MKLDNQTSCEQDKFIIEVLGLEHSEDQSLFIAETQDDMIVADSKEALDKSTLNLWETKGKKWMQAYLKIEAEEGDPFSIELFDRLEPRCREAEHQKYMVAPFIPLTLDFRTADGKKPLALARAGFLYIFKKDAMTQKDRLWREVAIDSAEDGTPEYRETNVYAARNWDHDKPVDPEKIREFISKPLKEIWLPVRNDGSYSRGFRAFYSEIQLSAERINYLEENAKELRSRSYPLKLKDPVDVKPSGIPESGAMVWMQSVAAQLQRSPLTEWLYEQPWEFLSDTSGSYAKKVYQAAEQEVKTGHPSAELGELNPAARLQALLSQQKDNEELPDADSNEVIWQDYSGPDVTEESKKRQLVGLVLHDEMYVLRYYLTQAQESKSQLASLLQAAMAEEHYKFAELVNMVILPQKLGDKPNELAKEYAEFVDTSDDAPFSRIMKVKERKRARHTLEYNQKKLLERIKSKRIQVAITDLFTLNGGDYYAGFKLIGDVFSALMDNPKKMDTLYATQHGIKQRFNTQAITYIRRVFEDSEYRLHTLLFPAEHEVPLDKPFDGLCEDVENKGDGRCRVYELVQLAKKENKFNPEESETFDIALLAGVSGADVTSTSLGSAKRLVNDIGAVMDGLSIAAVGASSAMAENTMTVNMKMYGPILRLMKAADPKVVGQIFTIKGNQLGGDDLKVIGTGFNGVNTGYTEGAVVKGNYGRAYGELYDQDGRLYGDTNKTRMAKTLKSSEGKETIKALQKVKEDITFFVARKGTYLDTLMDNYANTRTSAMTNKVNDVLGSTHFSLFVILVEFWNVSAESGALEVAQRQGRSGRQLFSTASAIYDFTFAMNSLVNSAFGHHAAVQRVQAVLAKQIFTEAVRSKLMQRYIARPLLRAVISRLPASIAISSITTLVGGGLTVAVMVMDMCHEIATGDYDAAVGMGIAAIGVGMVSVSFFYGALVLGIVGVLISIVGLVLYFIFNDDPMQELLSHGPLSKEPKRKALGYLIDDDSESFYRLFNLLAGYAVYCEKNPEYQNPASLKDEVLQTFTHRVRVESIVGTLFGPSSHTTKVMVKRTSGTASQGGASMWVDYIEPKQVITEVTHAGENYYLNLPEDELHIEKGIFGWGTKSVDRTAFSPAIRSQIKARLDNREWVFPGPSPTDPLKYNPSDASHSKPDFKKKEQVFWLDEVTYQAKESD